MTMFVSGTASQLQKIQELASKLADTSKDFPKVENLPVDLPSIKGNRKTKSASLIKQLQAENGFNKSLWRLPNLIKVKADVAKRWLDDMMSSGLIDQEEYSYFELGFIGDYWYARWDGDHRHKLYKGHMQVPLNELCDLKYDCMVYEVDNVETANDLFVKIQKTRQTSLGPDDEWVNSWLSRSPSHIRTGELMLSCSVGVKHSDGKMYPRSKFNDQAWVTSRIFEMCVEKYGIETTQKAIQDITEVLATKPSWNQELYGSMYGGLACLYKNRPLAAKNGLNQKIKEILKGSANLSKKDMIEIFKTKGGNEHNRELESVALGIAKLTKNAINDGAFGPNRNAGDGLKIDSLKNDLGLKAD